MRQLGPILFDYDQLWMEFTHQTNRIWLQGLTQPQCDQARLVALSKYGVHIGQFYHLVVESVNPDQSPTIWP